MKNDRCISVHWKDNSKHELFSSLTSFYLFYPEYSEFRYQIENKISRKKIPYETDKLIIERKIILK